MNPPNLPDDLHETADQAPFGLSEDELQELREQEAEENALAADEAEHLRAELEEVKLERDDVKTQLLRSYADLQNFRRMSQQRIQDTRRDATEDVLRSLLPVLDNFERSLIAIQTGADVQSVTQGVTMVQRQMVSSLEQFELKRMIVVGERFDPERHEAVTTWDSPDHEDGVITDVIEPGYMIGDRILRPAKVRVVRKG